METNDELIDHLIKRGDIQSKRIEEAFRKVDRAKFVDSRPYMDRPSYLEEGSTVSAPHIVAQMLEILEPEGKILEMGSGSGYVLALLSELSDEVVGVERIKSLVEKSREKVPEAQVIHGDSIPNEEFDKIIYSFATQDVREALNHPNIVVAPVVEDDSQILKKFENGEVKEVTRVRFVEERKGLRND